MAEESTQDSSNGSVATGKDSLTVTDNRTGETYEMEISDGTVKAMDFRSIKVNEDDFGLMTYDPAFTNTANCRSDITYIDGEAACSNTAATRSSSSASAPPSSRSPIS